MNTKRGLGGRVKRLPGAAAAAGAALVFSTLPATAAAWSYAEAAKPYAGQSIVVLDEVTPLQQAMQRLVPEFTEETGIEVDYQLLNHFEVISKGQADMLSGRGAYDAVMVHSPQMGLLLKAGVVREIDDLLANSELTSPELDLGDMIQPGWDTLCKFEGATYCFLNWNYNEVYWARNDLLSHPDERAAFEARYGYELGPARTLQQLRDNAEFFTRKKGEEMAGKTLESDFYGIVQEGIKGGTTFWSVWNNFIRNFGGDIFDEEGRPTVDREENIEAVKFWASLWKYAPPGQAEYSLIDVPNVMGNGVAAQAVAWSDFVLGVDQPGSSQYAGQFVYAGIPHNADKPESASAETEPSGLIVSKHSEHPEATYLFLQWVIDTRTQERFIESTGVGLPVRESSWSLETLSKSRLANLYEAMRQSLAHGEAKPRAPDLYQIQDVLGGILQEIALGRKTAEEGLREGQEKVLAICKRCLL